MTVKKGLLYCIQYPIFYITDKLNYSLFRQIPNTNTSIYHFFYHDDCYSHFSVNQKHLKKFQVHEKKREGKQAPGYRKCCIFEEITNEQPNDKEQVGHNIHHIPRISKVVLHDGI